MGVKDPKERPLRKTAVLCFCGIIKGDNFFPLPIAPEAYPPLAEWEVESLLSHLKPNTVPPWEERMGKENPPQSPFSKGGSRAVLSL